MPSTPDAYGLVKLVSGSDNGDDLIQAFNGNTQATSDRFLRVLEDAGMTVGAGATVTGVGLLTVPTAGVHLVRIDADLESAGGSSGDVVVRIIRSDTSAEIITARTPISTSRLTVGFQRQVTLTAGLQLQMRVIWTTGGGGDLTVRNPLMTLQRAT